MTALIRIIIALRYHMITKLGRRRHMCRYIQRSQTSKYHLFWRFNFVIFLLGESEKGVSAYWIKKQIAPFSIHPSHCLSCYMSPALLQPHLLTCQYVKPILFLLMHNDPFFAEELFFIQPYRLINITLSVFHIVRQNGGFQVVPVLFVTMRCIWNKKGVTKVLRSTIDMSMKNVRSLIIFWILDPYQWPLTINCVFSDKYSYLSYLIPMCWCQLFRFLKL